MRRIESAYLYLWNDYDDRRRAEYEEWHTFEHVPERVSLPGFEAGYRYSSDDPGTTTYFTFYKLASLQALQSPDYTDVVDHPTPWSAKMRPAFRNVFRLPASVVAVQGIGLSGWVAPIVFETARLDSLVSKTLQNELTERLYSYEITGFQLSTATEVPSYKVFDQETKIAPESKLIAVVLAGSSKIDLQAASTGFIRSCEGEVDGLKLLRKGVYSFRCGIETAHNGDILSPFRNRRDNLKVGSEDNNVGG